MQNVFWDVAFSDPHLSISWDRLHAYHAGLFGKHIWPKVQAFVTSMGRAAIQKVDKQYVH
jgi:hypothetical protein